MKQARKVLLTGILAVIVAAHAALFLEGGKWRKLGLTLVAVDVVSAFFLVGAIRESRKLDRRE
jgi:hypothetical protein